jgi:hypothetical protein
MNERLQELAREAGYFEFNKWDYFDIDKFAELIVKECAWLVDENDISLPYGTFGKLIKGHFGVEE